jgi:peptide/nickel transport system substrate-binding protein
VSWSPEASSQINKQWAADSAKKFNEAGRALVGETDPEKRRALFDVMLTEWEVEAPATLLYQPLETYGVKKSIKWQPYTFYYMDFRPYNLAFGK